MFVWFHVLLEVDLLTFRFIKSFRAVGLHHCWWFLCKACDTGVAGPPNYNNPSQQSRAVSDFDVHVLLITMYYRSTVTEAEILSL